MLRRAPFPPAREAISDWFANHAREWHAGEAFRFAVELHGRVIGVTDIDEVAGAEGELGYWFERASWGHGYALEAAQAIVHFAVTRLGLRKLRSAHAADNPASGKVLSRLGFQPLDTLSWPSLSRGTETPHQRYVLSSPKIG